MAERKLKVGDPVLWYGHHLEVTGFETKDTAEGPRQVVCCEQVSEAKARAAARKAIAKARTEQEKLGPALRLLKSTNPTERAKGREAEDRYEELAAEILKHDDAAREALVRAKLRADLLTFWTARGVWVSEGKILTDAQHKNYQAVNGGARARPLEQRAAYDILEERGLLAATEG